MNRDERSNMVSVCSGNVLSFFLIIENCACSSAIQMWKEDTGCVNQVCYHQQTIRIIQMMLNFPTALKFLL